MPVGNEDRSLADRLAALRGSPSRAPPTISIDTIERAKTPTREDALAARLKLLRETSSPASTPVKTQQPTKLKFQEKTGQCEENTSEDYDVDAAFRTDDDTLEDLYGTGGDEPDDEKVRALLEELSMGIPKDEMQRDEQGEKDDEKADDSDVEEMQKEVNDMIARFRDVLDMEPKDTPHDKNEETEPGSHINLPSVPATLPNSPNPPYSMKEMAARLSDLKAPSSIILPQVPTSKPTSRLTSTTAYTDKDVDSWCTVCLEDATLKCVDCDEDPYCARCWREMHLGAIAGFGDGEHRVLQFNRGGKERKIAIGA